jgi:predicted RNA-binding Zn ribbon-like protein
MELLCLDIINSNKIDWRTAKVRRDMLNDDVWLRELLQKWQLGVSLSIDDVSLNALKTLRDNMTVFIETVNLGGKPQKELAYINNVLMTVVSTIQLTEQENNYCLETQYKADSWPLFIWHVADSFVKLISQCDKERIKICDNCDCGWVFYDESKNKSRRWCDSKVCGNIMKVREFRARHKNNG